MHTHGHRHTSTHTGQPRSHRSEHWKQSQLSFQWRSVCVRASACACVGVCVYACACVSECVCVFAQLSRNFSKTKGLQEKRDLFPHSPFEGTYLKYYDKVVMLGALFLSLSQLTRLIRFFWNILSSLYTQPPIRRQWGETCLVCPGKEHRPSAHSVPPSVGSYPQAHILTPRCVRSRTSEVWVPGVEAFLASLKRKIRREEAKKVSSWCFRSFCPGKCQAV